MNIDQLPIGTEVQYVARTCKGKGTVASTYEGGRGWYVTVTDKATGKPVTVRPSQVYPATARRLPAPAVAKV